jgi:hypothetical protein
MSTDAGASPIAVGMPITTQDGDAVGTVKEVQAGYFKVDVRLQPDYWLQTDFAQISTDGQVVLQFAKAELGHYKVKTLPDRVVDETTPLTAEAVRPLDPAAPGAAPPPGDHDPRPPA